MPIFNLRLQRIFISAFFIFFGTHVAFSIDKGDSLVAIARDIQQPVNNRLKAYKDLVFYFETSDPDKAIVYGNEGIELPRIDSLVEELARLYENMAFVHISAQEYQEAIPYLKKSAGAFATAGNIKKVGGTYKNIGVLNRKLGNYPESIKYQMLSLENYEELGDTAEQVAVLMNIGNIYVYQKQPGLGFPYFQKAYDLAQTQSDSLVTIEAINSYAFGFDHMAKKDTALYYYLIAIDGYNKLNKFVKKAKAEHNVALIYMAKEEYLKAEKMLLSSLNVFNQLPATMDIEKATVKSSLGRVYANSDRHNLAVKFLTEALDVFRKKDARTEEKTALEYLSQSLANQGRFKEAYKYHIDFMLIKDSIQNSEILAEVADLTERYESNKKEKEIIILQHEHEQDVKFKLIFISISGAVISSLIIGFLIYHQRKLKETEQIKNRFIQNARELDILRQKIANETTQYTLPHEFTFNRDEVNSLLKQALSDRELDVFMLLLEGHTNRAISEKLFVSVNTIKFHLQNIYVKLDVDNRTDAILSVSSSIDSKSEMVYTTV